MAGYSTYGPSSRYAARTAARSRAEGWRRCRSDTPCHTTRSFEGGAPVSSTSESRAATDGTMTSRAARTDRGSMVPSQRRLTRSKFSGNTRGWTSWMVTTDGTVASGGTTPP